jgi:hypothetical protein
MRILVPLIIDMGDDEAAGYAGLRGIEPGNGRDVAGAVQREVRALVAEAATFVADVSISGPELEAGQ